MLGKKNKQKKQKQEERNTDNFGVRAEHWMVIERYLEERGRYAFVEKWADICEKTSGRVSYDELYELVGKDFPRAPWLNPLDRNANIKAFFEVLNIPCIADDTHIYFP